MPTFDGENPDGWIFRAEILHHEQGDGNGEIGRGGGESEGEALA